MPNLTCSLPLAPHGQANYRLLLIARSCSCWAACGQLASLIQSWEAVYTFSPGLSLTKHQGREIVLQVLNECIKWPGAGLKLRKLYRQLPRSSWQDIGRARGILKSLFTCHKQCLMQAVPSACVAKTVKPRHPDLLGHHKTRARPTRQKYSVGLAPVLSS